MLPEDMSQMLIINVESVIETVKTGEKKMQDKEVFYNFLVFIFSREKYSLPNLFWKYIQLGKF